MIGALLGTAPGVFYPGEYFAFYHARWVARSILGRVPSSVRDEYLEDLEAHAVAFAVRKAHEAGASVFCDATPWNLMIAGYLSEILPNATFFVCIRRPEGVIDSLARSYDSGYRWAGATLHDRARVYAEFYQRTAELPEPRTVVFDYDSFCMDPEIVLDDFIAHAASALDRSSDNFRTSVVAEAHAPALGSGPPIGTIDAGGVLRLCPRPSFDTLAWNAESRAAMLAIVAPALRILHRRFPTTVAASILSSVEKQ